MTDAMTDDGGVDYVRAVTPVTDSLLGLVDGRYGHDLFDALKASVADSGFSNVPASVLALLHLICGTAVLGHPVDTHVDNLVTQLGQHYAAEVVRRAAVEMALLHVLERHGISPAEAIREALDCLKEKINE